MTPTRASKKSGSDSDSMIHSRALLVWLTLSTWSGRSFDRSVTDKVNRDSGSTDAGRFNKLVMGPQDSAAFGTLLTTANSIRAQHYARTLAWSDEGWRLLTTASYMDYMKWHRSRRSEFMNALDAFAHDYPNAKNRAMLRNKLAKPEDYPSMQDIRTRFAMDVNVSPLPSFGDVRVELDRDQIAQLESNLHERVQAATKIAIDDAWQRLHKVVAAIADKLNDPKAIFRDSLIGNAKEMTEILKRLNPTNNADLEAMRARVADELTQFDPDVLRDTPRVRKAVGQKADDILKAMRGLYSEVA